MATLISSFQAKNGEVRALFCCSVLVFLSMLKTAQNYIKRSKVFIKVGKTIFSTQPFV